MTTYFPKPFYVVCTVTPTKRNGLKEPATHRVGFCATEAEIAKLIADDKRAMSNTYGGLIDPVAISDRTYRAFRAVWTEIAL